MVSTLINDPSRLYQYLTTAKRNGFVWADVSEFARSRFSPQAIAALEAGKGACVSLEEIYATLSGKEGADNAVNQQRQPQWWAVSLREPQTSNQLTFNCTGETAEDAYEEAEICFPRLEALRAVPLASAPTVGKQTGNQVIRLDAFDIVVTVAPGGGGAITSSLHEADESREAKAALDAIESIILAHAAGGIEVNSPRYLEGIETAVQAIWNQYGDVGLDMGSPSA